MIRFDAWHAPLLDATEVQHVDERAVGGIMIRTPVLRPGALTRLAARLRAARRDVLLDRPVSAIIDSIDAAAVRVTTGTERAIALATLPHAAGMSDAMAAYVLDRMAHDWRAAALHALLRSELADPDMLDGYVAHGGRRVRALGAPLVTHVFAGNVPGVSVTSLIRALLVRSASIGKSAAGEPVLAPLFARALHAVDETLATCIAVLYWEGGGGGIEDEALGAADTVVAYGSGETVASLRARTPAGTAIIEHGPKLSIGYVARAALDDDAAATELAAAIARATATFDQHGCVSPHVVFVERNAHCTTQAFARMVANSLGELAAVLPRRTLSAADAARLRESVTRAEFRAIAGEDVEVFESDSAVVIHDASAAFEASCLDRTLYIKPVDMFDHVIDIVAPYRDVMQSAAVAGLDAVALERCAVRLAAAGVTRVTDFERLPWPDASWHHDGRGPLIELLRFHDLDPPGH